MQFLYLKINEIQAAKKHFIPKCEKKEHLHAYYQNIGRYKPYYGQFEQGNDNENIYSIAT